MTPKSFRANPAQWHQSTDLKQMLSLLQHLANDGNVTVVLLAADFAERSFPYAGSNKAMVKRCVMAVRTWARDPTAATLQECKDAADDAYAAYYTTYATYAAHAADAAYYAAYYAAYAAYAAAANAASAAYAASTHAADAASANAAYARVHSNARQVEQQWQLAHVRKKHPLTEL